jgi:hypothetical protein
MEFVLVATRGSKKEKISSPPLLELSAAYFQPVSSIFLSHTANNTFSRLFSAQANKLLIFGVMAAVPRN